MKLVITCVLALLVAGPVAAQDKGIWEFGVDAGLVLSFVGEVEGEQFWEDGPAIGGVDSRTDFNAYLPGTSWRIAYFVTSAVALEVPLSFRYGNYGKGYGTEWAYSLETGLGLTYNWQSGVFAGVRGTVAVSDAGYSDSYPTRNADAWDTYALGATLGFRKRVFADNIRFRTSLDYEHQFEKDSPTLWSSFQPHTNRLGLAVGFSVLI